MKSFNIEYKNLPLFEKNLIKSNFYNIALDKTVFREVTIFKVGKTAAEYAKIILNSCLIKSKGKFTCELEIKIDYSRILLSKIRT